MKTNDDKTVHYYNEFQRTRYFQGMLLNDDDFKSEQNYQAGKRRLFNRMLHGAGIVCGLDVKWNKNDQSFTVNSGLAIDCQGNEIWVNQARTIRLAQLWPLQRGKQKTDPCDKSTGESKNYHLVVRFEERETDPVSVYLSGSSCDNRNCENSRIKEGYRLMLVEAGNNREVVTDQSCKFLIDCPDCGSGDKSCNVVLGSLIIDNSDGSVVENTINTEWVTYVIGARRLGQILNQLITSVSKSLQYSPTHNSIETLCLVISMLDAVQLNTDELKSFLEALKVQPVQPTPSPDDTQPIN